MQHKKIEYFNFILVHWRPEKPRNRNKAGKQNYARALAPLGKYVPIT